MPRDQVHLLGESERDKANMAAVLVFTLSFSVHCALKIMKWLISGGSLEIFPNL
jgi:hypothetical protein